MLVDWLGGEREGDFSEAAHDHVKFAWGGACESEHCYVSLSAVGPPEVPPSRGISGRFGDNWATSTGRTDKSRAGLAAHHDLSVLRVFQPVVTRDDAPMASAPHRTP